MGLARRWQLITVAIVIGGLAIAGNVYSCRDHRAEPRVVKVTKPHLLASVGARNRVSKDPLKPPPPAGSLRLEGQVVDEQDAPVAGARVLLDEFAIETTSEADGSFAFEHLGAHRYEIGATKGDDSCSEHVFVKLSEITEPVILRVMPGASTIVRVLDGDSKAPLPNVPLHTSVCGPPDWECQSSGAVAATDSQGLATLHGLVPGWRLRVYVVVDGYEEKDVDLALRSDPKEKREMTVELLRGAPASGRVLGSTGEPVEGATVIAMSEQGRTEVKTDARGAWEMSALTRGTHRWFAHAERTRPGPPLELELDGIHPRRDLVLRVENYVEVHGSVVDEKGAAVASAVVHGGWSSPAVETDHVGRFTVWAPAGRQFSLWATKGERGSPRATVAADRTQQEFRLVIAPSTIAGVVVDDRGNAVAGAIVHMTLYSGASQNAECDANGRFDVQGIEPGTLHLSASRANQAFGKTGESIEAKSGARDLRVVVPDVATLSGRVTLDGKPVPYFGISIGDSDSRGPDAHWQTVRSPDGRFSRAGMPEGTWTIKIFGPGFVERTLENVVTQEGRDKDLGNIVVEHGVRIRGRVSDGKGAPIGGATVTVHHSRPFLFEDAMTLSQAKSVSATTDAAGAYVIDDVSPPIGGNHIVANHPALGTSGERSLSDGDVNVDLTIVGSGSISGKLVGSHGIVTLVRPEDPSFVITVGADLVDHFHVENLAPGDYVLRVPFEPILPVRATVVATQTTNVVLSAPAKTVALIVNVSGACESIELQVDDAAHDEADRTGCHYAKFDRVAPGDYRICVDGKNCQRISIPQEPATQTIELHAP